MELLAKSKAVGESRHPATIVEHSDAVRDAAEEIWNCVESDLENALDLQLDELRTSILPSLLLAAVLHDVGKANGSFQALVHGTGGTRKRQPVRHEVLTGVLMTSPDFWASWFAEGLAEFERWAVVWAMSGHHREIRAKRMGDSEDPLFRTGNVPSHVTLYLADSQLAGLLDRAARILQQYGFAPGERPLLADRKFDTRDETPSGLEAAVRGFANASFRAWKRLGRRPEFRRKVAILKALLIAADVAGSAIPATEKPLCQYVRDSLSLRLQPSDLQAVVDDNLKGRKPRRFQSAVACSPRPITIVTAGCGNGKTTAAYLWAKKWAKSRKLFFAYPTTGTASAGFEDYLFAQTQLERDLMHSRAEVDLEAMAESPDIPPLERAQRLESVRAWGQQAIACTVDSVLGLIQNQRRPLFAFPAIACGAFVFDEIHSYDRRLFSELLRFLETFPGIPVLIMSASIPPNRLAALRKTAGDRMNEQPIPGDERLENVLRYRIEPHEISQCCVEVKQLLQSKDIQAPKVLWVCNTVATAINVFRHARQRLPDVEILLYHSRYRYRDRVNRQKEVIKEFEFADAGKTVRRCNRPALVVTTQVCEMSLDISADMLVSAFCPLPSLVQRLGRLNRYTLDDDPKPAYVYPFSGQPYHKEDHPLQVEATKAMIAALCGEPCNQRTLGEFLEGMQSSEDWSKPEDSAWLDGGWETEPLPARDGDNSITVVREEDLDSIRYSYTSNQIIPYTIPMLCRHGFSWEQRACGYPVAPSGSIDYDEEGARWAD